MAKPILVANWKNYPGSLKEASALLTALQQKSGSFKNVSLFIAPPYVYFESVVKRLKKSAHLASQDIFFTPEGVHTGSISPDILKSFNVKMALIGHSERRALGETNEVVAAKLKTALRSGITPLLCVGETVRDDDGNHFEVVRDQLKFSLEGMRRKEDAGKLVIAYEPVWAIGSKSAMTPADLAQMVIFIKKVLNDIFGRAAADAIPVLYGGSVTGDNAAQLMKDSGIKGLLVGRSSLNAKEFALMAKSISS